MYTLITPIPAGQFKLPQQVVYHAFHAFTITNSRWVIVSKSRDGYAPEYYVNRYIHRYKLTASVTRSRIILPAECSTAQVIQTIRINLGCVEHIDFYAEYNNRLYQIPISPVDAEYCCVNMVHPNPEGYRAAVQALVEEIDCLRVGIERKAYIDEILEIL